MLAAGLAAFRHRSAARVALVVAWVEIAAFAFFHAVPVEIGPCSRTGATAWATRSSGRASC